MLTYSKRHDLKWCLFEEVHLHLLDSDMVKKGDTDTLNGVLVVFAAVFG